MKQEDKISSRMKEEHEKMFVLLKEFEEGKSGALEKLIDVQRRHTFAEEKAIMSFYTKKKEFEVLTILIEQHREMGEDLSDLEDGKDIVKQFLDLMKEHIKLEDSKFYPMLDKDLTIEEQNEMFREFMSLFDEKRSF